METLTQPEPNPEPFDPEAICVSGNREFENMLTFTHPQVKGEIFITFPESEKDGIPEIDYDSFTTIGGGSPKEVYNAIRLAREAVRIYRERTGYGGVIGYAADNRDDAGNQRAKIFRRYLPDLKNKGLSHNG